MSMGLRSVVKSAYAAAMNGSGSPLREAVAEEVRALLGRRRLSAVKLARRTGLSQPYLSRRLSGRMSFDLDDLDQIADALEVSPMLLFPADLIARRDIPAPRRPESLVSPGRPRQTRGPRGRTR